MMRPLSPEPGDEFLAVYISDDDEEQQRIKRRKISQLADKCMKGRPLYISTSCLKGPFGPTWTNPWAKEHRISVGLTSTAFKAATVSQNVDTGPTQRVWSTPHSADKLSTNYRDNSPTNNVRSKLAYDTQPKTQRRPVLSKFEGVSAAAQNTVVTGIQPIQQPQPYNLTGQCHVSKRNSVLDVRITTDKDITTRAAKIQQNIEPQKVSLETVTPEIPVLRVIEAPNGLSQDSLKQQSHESPRRIARNVTFSDAQDISSSPTLKTRGLQSTNYVSVHGENMSLGEATISPRFWRPFDPPEPALGHETSPSSNGLDVHEFWSPDGHFGPLMTLLPQVDSPSKSQSQSTSFVDNDVMLDSWLDEASGFLEDWSVESELRKGSAPI
jgi:hypothetical protein